MRRFAGVLPLFILAAALIPAQPGVSQEQSDGLKSEVFLAVVRTDAGASGTSLALSLPKITQVKMKPHVDKQTQTGTMTRLWTTLTLVAGQNDAFNGVIAKLEGNHVIYKTDEQGEWDVSKPFHVFPVSLGFESNAQFDEMNLLAEVGYVPFHLSKMPTYSLGFNPSVGVFLQAGHKFKLHDASASPSGGAADESEEQPNSSLLRLKGTARANIAVSKGKGAVSLVPEATGWYDIANSAFYYQIKAVLSCALSESTNLDIWKYERGSGAPNFNKGDQFSSGLTIQF